MHRVIYVHFNTAGSWLYEKYAVALMQAGATVEIACVNYQQNNSIQGFYDQSVPTRIFGYGHTIKSRNKLSKLLERTWVQFQKKAEVNQLQHFLAGSKATHLVAADPFALAVCAQVAKAMGARCAYIPFEYYPKHIGSNARRQKQYESLERDHICSADQIIFLGDILQEEYQRIYPIAEKAHVIYSTWPSADKPRELKLRTSAGLNRAAKVVLYQGTIELDRGLGNVVEALVHLPIEVVLVIMGYGSARTTLEQKAAALRLKARVRILPQVPQKELMAYTRDATVGIIPLRNVQSHTYSCPGKLFEYIAAGLPMVVSDMPNLKRIVEKYELGEVFASDSVPDLARALSKLVLDEAYRARCAQHARQAQETVFCWEKQSRQLCDIVFT